MTPVAEQGLRRRYAVDGHVVGPGARRRRGRYEVRDRTAIFGMRDRLESDDAQHIHRRRQHGLRDDGRVAGARRACRRHRDRRAAAAAQREKLAARFPGVGVHAALGEGALAGADIVVLAVKPQQMQDAARQLSPFIGVVPLVLTIAAGVRCADLSALARGLRPDRPGDAEYAGADRRGHQRVVCDTAGATERCRRRRGCSRRAAK